MQITENAIGKIKGNNIALGALCMAFNRHMKTIEAWVTDKNMMLTTPKAVDVIKEHTGLTEDQILEQETVAA